MKQKFASALSLALIVAMLFTSVGLADNVVTDGDGLTPLVDTPSLHLGNNVCLGSTTTKSIAHAISKNGGYPSTNVFAKNAVVTVSITTLTGSVSAGGGGAITIPSNWDTVANNTLSPAVSSSVTFVANSLGPISANVNYSASGTGSNGGTLTRTDSLSITGTVVNCDTTAPTLNLPGTITAEATGPSGAVVTYSATASDANPLNPTVTCSKASGSTFALGTTTVNCSATDAAGNTANGSFTVKVQDTTPPAVTPPSDITVEAVDANGATVSYSGEAASDLVSGSLSVSCLPASGSTFSLGLNTVTCSATDGQGNTGTSTFTINVQDTTAPIIAVPSDLTEEATGPNGAAVSFSVSASDAVDGNVTPSCDANSGDTFPLGSTEVSCSATDDAGNTSAGSFNVNVVDTTAPSLSLPASFTVEAESPAGASATFSASATDIVDGPVAVVCDANSGDTFSLGSNTINCLATDDAGNIASGSFEITVQDTTPPSLTLPADQQLEATGPTGAVATFAASAIDLVDGALQVSCDADSGDTFPLGTTTVECSVSDAAGNSASGSFIIIVQDTTAPSLSLPSNITKEATGPSGAAATFTASASDIVSGSVTPICSPASGSTFALGTTTVNCTATDAAGNSASGSFTVSVVDTTAPTLTLPSSINVSATSAAGAVVTFSASANDIVDGAVAVSCTPASGSTFAPGTTTVNCTATDAAGNTASGNFTVSVRFQLSGFYQPVDIGGVVNTVKNGSTVPLKFEVFAGATELSSTSIVNQPLKATQTLCSGGTTDEIELLSTGATSLRYDSTAGQFIYNWQTPKKIGYCYVVTITMADGSSISANFKLK